MGEPTDDNWATIMERVRRVRRELSYSRRLRFDLAIRPHLESGHVIEYPDAIYYVTWSDVDRAEAAVGYEEEP